jgi:hypothetical protein
MSVFEEGVSGRVNVTELLVKIGSNFTSTVSVFTVMC